MPSGGSYEFYADLGREHLVWVVYASPELSLEPKDWWYPVVGRQDYRGFFREDLARDEAARLEEAGYETWVSEVDAFSTLGWFRDPVLNTFVDYQEVDFAELLFHELCHLKYYVRGNTRFSEGMAEAVAREGVRRWFRATGRPAVVRKYEGCGSRGSSRPGSRSREPPGGSGRSTRARSPTPRNEGEAAGAGPPERESSRLRAEWDGGLQDWINDPVNNARLKSFITYEAEVGRFAALLDECGGDFEEFWKRVRLLDSRKVAGGS